MCSFGSAAGIEQREEGDLFIDFFFDPFGIVGLLATAND